MRRLLLILLMLIVPLQWSWAAAASVCQHETASKTVHFGHHPHQHEAPEAQGDADSGSPSSKGSAGADHADCGVCHLSIAKLCSGVSWQPEQEADTRRDSASSAHFTSHVPAGPERPDRIATP